MSFFELQLGKYIYKNMYNIKYKGKQQKNEKRQN